MNRPNTLNNRAFDLFLNHELSETEEKSFLEKIENDDILMDEFQSYVLSKKAIQLSVEEGTKEMIERSTENILKEGFNIRKIIFQAAAVILLLFGGKILFDNFIGSSEVTPIIKQIGPPIAEKIFTPNPPPGTLSSAPEGVNIYLSYKEKKFGKAANQLETISKENKEYARAKLFQGYSFFQSTPPNFKKAIISFDEVLSYTKNPTLKDYAEWNKLVSMVALEEVKTKDFETLWKKIRTDKNHTFHKQANELISKE